MGNNPTRPSLFCYMCCQTIPNLNISSDDLDALLRVDPAAFIAELDDLDEFMAKVGDRLPDRMTSQIRQYRERLKNHPHQIII